VAYGNMPFVVLDERNAFYYRGLSEYDNEPWFLRETVRSFQDNYFDRFKDFFQLTGNGGPN
jgi:hypothetical protein